MTEANNVAAGMGIAEAENLAAFTLEAMDNNLQHSCFECPEIVADYRERITSDLAGIREHEPDTHPWASSDHTDDYWRVKKFCGAHTGMDTDSWGDMQEWPCPDVLRYAEGLRRTAALYGVGKEP